TFALVTAPIYFADPDHFSPLHTYNELGRFDGVAPHLGLVIPAACVAVAAILGWLLVRGVVDARYAILLCAIVVGLPVVAGAALSAATGGDWLAYLSFGSLSAVFWAIGAHPFLADPRPDAVAPADLST